MWVFKSILQFERAYCCYVPQQNHPADINSTLAQIRFYQNYFH
jgi:hypothetical protein